jgi:hypothetical protein
MPASRRRLMPRIGPGSGSDSPATPPLLWGLALQEAGADHPPVEQDLGPAGAPPSASG